MNKDYELSNVSFTNKDFFDVYPELLQLAKRLSDKWDPTVSNESDPGVVLIKELALITDKINYIADKYALENNPRSVTQVENARQLYNLLGYYPEWYESAKVNLSMYWDGDPEVGRITIPKFTSVQDDKGEFIYTTLADISLPLDGSFATGDVEAIEGTYNRLIVNNSDIITLSMISDDQRIYIDNYNVAMNGIFITDSTGKIPWTQMRNINVAKSESTVYSFNVDIVTGKCYIQFPRDIHRLIGDGLIIHYILSKGESGNIPINYLTKLSVTSLEDTDENGDLISIDTKNIVVTNSGNTVRGKDPVSIDEMYENWKHIAGTFDTLVTLRDYNNAVKRLPDIVSNGFVCDRTNDVQCSYKVMYGTPEMPSTSTKIEKTLTAQDILNDIRAMILGDKEPDLVAYDLNKDGVISGVDLITARDILNGDYSDPEVDWSFKNIPGRVTPYDLKLYCLQSFPYDTIDNYQDYNSTFTILSDYDNEQFAVIWENQEFELNDNSTKKLVDALNDFQCISHTYKLPEPEKICMLKNKYVINLQIYPNQDLTKPQVVDLKRNICRAVYEQFSAYKVDFGEKISYDDLLDCIKEADSRIKTAVLDRLTFDTYAIMYKCVGGENGIEWFEIPVSDGAYNAFLEDERTLFCKRVNDEYEEYWDIWSKYWKRDKDIIKGYADEFRKEIVAKNILAGITPFIVDVGGGYPYAFNNRKQLDDYADHVKTNMFIPMVFTSDKGEYSITLRENEVIQFSSPNLLELRTYGPYIYYEYIGSRVDANTNYVL